MIQDMKNERKENIRRNKFGTTETKLVSILLIASIIAWKTLYRVSCFVFQCVLQFNEAMEIYSLFFVHFVEYVC